MPYSDIRLVLCDYDGVISPASTEALCAASYRVIRQYRPLPESAFRQLFRTLVPFPLQRSLQFLLESMGMEQHRGELLHALQGVVHGPLAHRPLLRHCQQQGLSFMVLSSSYGDDPKFTALREELGEGRLWADGLFSKVNPGDFQHLLHRLAIPAGEVLYLDDCPLALLTAHQLGIQTLHVRNGLFDWEQYQPLAALIPHSVGSLDEVVALLPDPMPQRRVG
jgi:beta-phosphoglucomutase-like phosphatase (HAD superfamily)